MASLRNLTIKLPKQTIHLDKAIYFIEKYNAETKSKIKLVKYIKCNNIMRNDCHIILVMKDKKHIVIKIQKIDKWREYDVADSMIKHNMYHDNILVPLKIEKIEDIGYIFYPYYKDEYLFYFMEKLFHTSIHEHVLKQIALNMLEALQYLNKYNLVHRDVKPENIFVAENGKRFILGDHEFISSPIITKDIKGTLNYISPEASGGIITYNGDIWSLGMTLYWCITYNFCVVEKQTPNLTHLKLMVDERVISSTCYDFIESCLTYDYIYRKSAIDLLKHSWFNEHTCERGIKRKVDCM